jgi:hypothetical protein
VLGQFVGLQAPLDAAQVIDPRPGLHPARREQRAAVLVRQLGDGERADPPRLGHDLCLVPAEQRPQDRQGHRVVEGGDVRQRLAGDLAEGVAGDQRGPAETPCQGSPGLEHQPALRHHLEPVSAGGGERLLRLAERHHEQP